VKDVDGVAIDDVHVAGLNRLGNGWRGERQEYRPSPPAHRTLLGARPARYRGALVSTAQWTYNGMPNQELHAAAGAAITGNGLSHVAAKATEAAAPEAAEASTTAARRVADRPTHADEATREAARRIGLR
jgi:hypothetical protein